MKAVILGSGITGITTAYFLAKAGYKVTVLEKESTSGMGCSYANGGQLSFSHAEPWVSRSSLFSILKAAIKKNSFFSSESLNSKDFIKWSLKSFKNSTPERTKDITRKLLKIGEYSRYNLDNILREEKVDFNYKKDGILHFYQTKKAFGKAIKQAEFQKSLGCKVKILTPAECVTKEPTLVKIVDENRLVGGIFFEDDASGDPTSFIKALEWICQNRLGVNFQYETEVKNVLTNYKKVTGINTDKGVFTGDVYISTLGSYGISLLKGIGVDLQIYPLKGYSLSIPTNKSMLSPKLSITDPANKIVYSRLGNVFRAAGTVEVCALNHKMNKKNIEFLKNTVRGTYSDFGDLNKAKEWYGFRPYRPDCLPMVCKVKKYGNLYVNSGHGSLGWTTAFATSKIISDVITKKDVGKDFRFFEDMEKQIYN